MAAAVGWMNVPIEARENYIFTGYRPTPIKGGISSCIISAVRIHNETLNIWTHLLPVLYFAIVFIGYTELDAALEPGVFDGYLQLSVLQRFPFYGYLLGIGVLFFTSSFAHIFNCVSCTWRNVCFMLDYAAISFYGVASAVAYYFYCRQPPTGRATGFLQCDTFFIGMTVLCAIMATTMSCYTRIHQTAGCHFIRTSSFALPFVVGSIPAFMRCWQIISTSVLQPTATTATTTSNLTDSDSHMASTRDEEISFLTSYVLHFVFMAGAAIVNVSKVPERWWPGWFDVWGHSHQWFHVLIFLSVRAQFWMVVRDMQRVVPGTTMTVANVLMPHHANVAVCTVCTLLLLFASLAFSVTWFSAKLQPGTYESVAATNDKKKTD